VASWSRGVRGGGSLASGLLCWGGEGRAEVSALRRDLREVLGKVWPRTTTEWGLMWIVDESESLREKPAEFVSAGMRPNVI
jgi:hypothetical protein